MGLSSLHDASRDRDRDSGRDFGSDCKNYCAYKTKADVAVAVAFTVGVAFAVGVAIAVAVAVANVAWLVWRCWAFTFTITFAVVN